MNICRLRGSAVNANFLVVLQYGFCTSSQPGWRALCVLVDCKLPIDSVCLRNTADNLTRYFAQQKFEQSVNVCSQKLDFFAG